MAAATASAHRRTVSQALARSRCRLFASGSGSEVEDVGGKCYLDFNSGQMCAAFGQPSDP